jgi:ABC-2 type transport system ATP-binding protein
MKRRVLVAQALVHKPPVIVLDEPTAGVDVELRQSLWTFHRRLNQQGPYHRADHALSGRSRNAVPARRHAARGRIVALDRTANLLHAGAERRLLLDLDTLPRCPISAASS